MNCPICTAENEEILWRNDKLRVIAVHNEANAPAFCRVIWQNHVAEMTDLDAAERAELMETVYRVESAMRQVFKPAKINLASLGNVVPQPPRPLAPRFPDAPFPPPPLWGAARRPSVTVLPADWPQQVRAVLQKEAV